MFYIFQQHNMSSSIHEQLGVLVESHPTADALVLVYRPSEKQPYTGLLRRNSHGIWHFRDTTTNPAGYSCKSFSELSYNWCSGCRLKKKSEVSCAFVTLGERTDIGNLKLVDAAGELSNDYQWYTLEQLTQTTPEELVLREKVKGVMEATTAAKKHRRTNGSAADEAPAKKQRTTTTVPWGIFVECAARNLNVKENPDNAKLLLQYMFSLDLPLEEVGSLFNVLEMPCSLFFEFAAQSSKVDPQDLVNFLFTADQNVEAMGACFAATKLPWDIFFKRAAEWLNVKAHPELVKPLLEYMFSLEMEMEDIGRMFAAIYTD